MHAGRERGMKEDFIHLTHCNVNVCMRWLGIGDEDTMTMEHNVLAFELQKALEEVRTAEMKEEVTELGDPEAAEEKRNLLDSIDVIDGRIVGEREKMQGLITVYRDILMEIPDIKE
jgi:hypothetical protein